MDLYVLNYNHKTFYFTSATEDITVGNITYKAIPIKRKEITMEVNADKFTVEAPLPVAPFQTMTTTAASVPATLELYLYPEMTELFKGNIAKTKHDYAKGIVTLEIASRFSNLTGKIPKRTYGVNCPYQLGDNMCGIVIDDYKVDLGPDRFSLAKTAVYSDIFNTPSNPDYWVGGYVLASTGEYQYILSQDSVNNKVTLLYSFAEEDSVTKLTVYPGCDKTLDTCRDVFHNNCNFGGFPHIPTNNPVSQGF